MSTIIDTTIQFVKNELNDQDGSHDWFHIERVWKMAKRISVEEGVVGNRLEIIQLASLLHDVGDWKYSGSETAATEIITKFLNGQNCSQENISRIVYIVENVSFAKGLSNNNLSKTGWRCQF